MKYILAGSLIFFGLLSCGPSHEALQLVRDQAAVADADYRDWKNLKEDQKEAHAFDHARSSAILNFSLNGVPVPPAYDTRAGITSRVVGSGR